MHLQVDYLISHKCMLAKGYNVSSPNITTLINRGRVEVRLVGIVGARCRRAVPSWVERVVLVASTS